MLDAATSLSPLTLGLSAFDVNTLNVLAVLALGLVAGTLGGLLGVGGSLVMIPGLTLMFGPNQQLYQAAAMIANIAVAIPATLRHRKANAIQYRVLIAMLPAAMVFIVVGVWLSNLFDGETGETWLSRAFAVLMVYVIYLNVRKLVAPPKPIIDAFASGGTGGSSASVVGNGAGTGGQAASGTQTGGNNAEPRITTPRGLFVGGAMGTVAGMLGVGGGAIAVPLQQLVLRLPLRNCIANSAAVMCISALIGAIAKNATLAQHAREGNPITWQDSVMLAALLAPTCIIGGLLGATLTHKLPLRAVRLAFILLLAVAAVRMARLG